MDELCFPQALKDRVTAGDLVQVKASNKLSPAFKEKAKSAGKPKKAAPRKKAVSIMCRSDLFSLFHFHLVICIKHPGCY